MELKKLDPVGIEIVDFDLRYASDFEIMEIQSLIAQYTTVVVRDQSQASVSDYERFTTVGAQAHDWGVWCGLNGHPKVLRVTNRIVNPETKSMGLFGDSELDWHHNGQFSRDPEQIVGMWMIHTCPGSTTYFVHGDEALMDIPADMRDELEGLEWVITTKTEDTFMGCVPYVSRGDEETKDMLRIIDRTRHEVITDPNLEKRYHRILHKPIISCREIPARQNFGYLYGNHNSVGTGLYFPLYSISGVVGKTDREGREIFEYIKNHMIRSDYIYKHYWSNGDIVLNDQRHSLHKRNEITGERELYRIAYWID